MTLVRRAVSLACLAAAAFTFALAPSSIAQDAMATDSMAADAMSAHAMAPMGDDDLAHCLDQAGMISFAAVRAAADAACHDLHKGALGDAMGGGAMMSGGAMMGGEAMAPATP